MELNTNTIGQRIRQRRNQLGLKQMEVKNAVGVSSGNMSDLENRETGCLPPAHSSAFPRFSIVPRLHPDRGNS